MDDPAWRRSQYGETFARCPAIGERPRNCPDLTGMRFGTLSVVGYHVGGSAHSRKGQSGRGNPLWVVMCDCGLFELRPARSIRVRVADDHGTSCCRECHAKRKTRSANPEKTAPQPCDDRTNGKSSSTLT